MIEQQLKIATGDGSSAALLKDKDGRWDRMIALVHGLEDAMVTRDAAALLEHVPGGESYHQEASELVWRRIETLFARKLAGASR